MKAIAWILVFGSLTVSGIAQEGKPELTGSALIDHWVRAKWDELGMKPAKAADDAEFLRRAFLDVVGVIPSAEETQQFLADSAADKRARLVERLVKDPRYVDYWADVWNELLLDYDSKGYYQAISLQGLREVFAANLPFDEFARRIVTIEGVVNYRNLKGLPAPNNLAAFIVRERYRSYPFVAQMTAARLTRIFLGVQIQCAQCHDHPFDKWTQDDYLGMVSFFRDLRAVRQKDGGLYHMVGDLTQSKGKAMIAGRVLTRTGLDDPGRISEKASFLQTGKGVEPGLSRRASFAKHMISENLQFARAAVNRYWLQFFGRGIVDPVDDFNLRNKPTHPELLDALAQDFVKHSYDLHWLIQTIVGSQAYQRTSRQTPRDPAAEKQLATARVRPLTPEQTLRSVAQATRLSLKDVVAIVKGRDPGPAQMSLGPTTMMSGEKMAPQPGTSDFPPEWTAHQSFRYVAGSEISDVTGTITGALLTMNGSVVSAGTALQRRKILDGILQGGRTPVERIRAIFLSTLNRPPTAKELERWMAHVGRGAVEEAYEDLFWTMINTSEFLLNH